MKKFLPWIGFSLLSVLLIATGIIVGNRVDERLQEMDIDVLGSGQDNRVTYSTTTVHTLSPSFAARMLLATSTERQLVRIVATSSGIYLGYNGAYVAAQREPLSSPLVIDLDHLFTGAIHAISDATTTVSVTTFYTLP